MPQMTGKNGGTAPNTVQPNTCEFVPFRFHWGREQRNQKKEHTRGREGPLRPARAEGAGRTWPSIPRCYCRTAPPPAAPIDIPPDRQGPWSVLELTPRHPSPSLQRRRTRRNGALLRALVHSLPANADYRTAAAAFTDNRDHTVVIAQLNVDTYREFGDKQGVTGFPVIKEGPGWSWYAHLVRSAVDW